MKEAPRPTMPLRILFAFLVRDIKVAASYRLQVFVQLASVLTLSLTFFFLAIMMSGVEADIPALRRYGGGYFGFALIGLAFSSYLDATLRSFSTALRQAQLTGTFQAMLATSAPLALVVAGSGLYTLCFTTLRVAMFLAIGVGLFELPLEQAHWGAALVVLLLTVLVTLVLGIFAAGFVVRFKQGDPITAAIAGLSWLLSGVVYPREIFPEAVQNVAYFLPMTHILEGMRLALLKGAPVEALMDSLRFLFVFLLIALPVSIAWFAHCVAGAKRAGALGHY